MTGRECCAHYLHRGPGPAPARRVDKGHALGVGGAQTWHDAHSFGHVHGRPSDVHRACAGAQPRGTLDDREPKSGPASQYARVDPAMPPPEIRTVSVTVSPSLIAGMADRIPFRVAS